MEWFFILIPMIEDKYTVADSPLTAVLGTYLFSAGVLVALNSSTGPLLLFSFFPRFARRGPINHHPLLCLHRSRWRSDCLAIWLVIRCRVLHSSASATVAETRLLACSPDGRDPGFPAAVYKRWLHVENLVKLISKAQISSISQYSHEPHAVLATPVRLLNIVPASAATDSEPVLSHSPL